MIETLSFRRRHLPHWIVADRTYFVTFRLKGTIPNSVLAELVAERNMLLQSNPSNEERSMLERSQFVRLEAILDKAQIGPNHLRDARIASLLMESFAWLDQQRGWDVFAAVVMPNHCHLLIKNREGKSQFLTRDIGVLKGYTAREANRILGLKGNFWQDESFDHWCRSTEKVTSAVNYIRQNPVRAGLVKRGGLALAAE